MRCLNQWEIGYLDHLAGSQDVIWWCLVILMFPLHIMEVLIKPVSLARRLFGNILGEISGLGLLWVGDDDGSFPSSARLECRCIFRFLLAILTSTVQALVFRLLSTIMCD